MATGDGNYVTIADIREEGVTVATASNTRIAARIAKWEGLVEKITRNVFRVLEPGALIFDGNNDRVLHFNIALVEVTEVKINGETTALQSSEYRAFVGKTLPQDDRYNPKIVLLGNRDVSTIFTTSHIRFVKGLDQEITAKWGFVEPDPDVPGDFRTPPAVKQAIVALVVRDLRGYFEQYFLGMANELNLPKKKERTDDHEIEWSELKIAESSLMTAIPPDIREVLGMYRAPWEIAIPEQVRFAYDAVPIYGW